jgi:hypothetical protein
MSRILPENESVTAEKILDSIQYVILEFPS